VPAGPYRRGAALDHNGRSRSSASTIV
jgi:hypothetical protein